MDIVTHPVNGPITVFRNNNQSGNAIGFAFNDLSGNRSGIGTVVEITTKSGQTQSRELQLGGGFMSFDAPVLYFGLGATDAIKAAKIIWPDGEISALGVMPAGAVYTLTRK